MIYGAYFPTTICPLHQNRNHTSSRSVRSSVLPTAIHLCSPLVIQLRTLAPATDAADRFLIILSLSARSIVCFKSARNVVSGRTEEWHCLIADEWKLNWKLGALPLPPPGNCCRRFSSITQCSLQVILYMSCPVIDTPLLCVGSIFKYSADLEPRCTLEGTESRQAGEEALHSIWDPALHSVRVEVNIPRPPRGFEKGKWWEMLTNR